jgi:hypothetical protein
MDEYHETVKNRILLPPPSPDEIDACDISSLRIALIMPGRELVTVDPVVQLQHR